MRSRSVSYPLFFLRFRPPVFKSANISVSSLDNIERQGNVKETHGIQKQYIRLFGPDDGLRYGRAHGPETGRKRGLLKNSARWIAGLLLLFIGLFVAASVFFSFFTWDVDQSILQRPAEERELLGDEVEKLLAFLPTALAPFTLTG